MPRVSQAALAALEVVESSPTSVGVIRRLRPPDELTEEQKAEFQRVVTVMPAEWFTPGNTAMLAQYCRHVIAARRLGELIEQATLEGKGEELAGLLKAQVAESRILHQLMTSLRMTPQSIAPTTVSQKRTQQLENPWSGFGKKRA